MQNAHFDSQVQGAHSLGIILNVPAKVNFTKLCTGESALYEWLGIEMRIKGILV